MGTQIGATHDYSSVGELTSPDLRTCPQCQTLAVPRGVTSTRKLNAAIPAGAPAAHCPYCGHVYGRNTLLNRKVRNIVVAGAASATTITTLAGTLQMSAAILPDYADNPAVTWSVAPGTGSATIDANGLLTAVGNGTVTVTATANDGSAVAGTDVITITNNP